MRKARIFISCGQKKGSEEEKVAEAIKERLVSLGFESDPPWPYVAITDQASIGVVDNIFQRLGEAEYVIFIDFTRKENKLVRLRGKKEVEYRGSLFSNQELAVAVFLKLKILPFLQKGLIKMDGIRNFIQLQPCWFESLNEVEEMVLGKVIEKRDSGEWKTNWRNELVINDKLYSQDNILDKDSHYHVYGQEITKITKFHHLEVENLHHEKMAENCAVFIESITNLQTKKKIKCRPIELKWTAIRIPSINIPPRGKRKFDLFKINHDSQHVVRLTYNRDIVDYSGVRLEYDIKGPGDFILNLLLFSRNLTRVEKSFDLHIGSTMGELIFRPSRKYRR